MTNTTQPRHGFEVDEAIRLGIRDLYPDLIQNWCSNLKIEYISVSPLGQMVHLPSLGSKKLSCKYAKYIHESVSLTTAATGFISQNCASCKHHKQTSWFNIGTFGKPWGWLALLLLRARSLAINWIRKHGTFIAVAFVCGFVLFPLLLAISVLHENLLQTLAQIDAFLGNMIYDKNILIAIAQINATVFALAFTIPIAATQLEKYRAEIPMFSGYVLYYMLFFIVSIFLPITIPEDSNLGYAASVAASMLCLLLMIPYLKWIKESLDPERIIMKLQTSSFSCVDRNQEKEFIASVERLHQIMIRSLSEKDYAIFGKAFEVLPKLARHCFFRKFMLSVRPPQGWLYLGREINRISELTIEDRTAIQIASEKILLLDLMSFPVNDNPERTFPLRVMENTGLSWLAKLAVEYGKKMSAIHPIAGLLKSSSFSTYKSEYQPLADAMQSQTIQFLLTMPEDVVDWAYSLNESEYKTRYGEGLLRVALLGIAARFYLKYKEKLKGEKTAKKDHAPK